MKLVEVLHMNGGIGDISYANNSLVQRKAILTTKPIIEQAMSDLYCSLFPKNVCIADLGCSSGANTLLVVPNLIEKNKGNIYMSSTSPPSVIKAYYKQYEKDFSNFLKYRSEELMKGRKMVLTFLGRESEDPSSKEGCYIWELLGMALNELVIEILSRTPLNVKVKLELGLKVSIAFFCKFMGNSSLRYGDS
ncbi:hypothetical protein KY285_037119 [Solanum tuberosum]|nr:hypothetical protein KY285_037119 [Solanum tuberosum]